MSDPAVVAERVAVLLGAGVAPASAWEHVSASPDIDPGVAAAWRIATEAGAPLAPTLHRIAETLRDLAESDRVARTALAGPRATTRLVMVLPLVGLVFGALLGFDTLGTLFTTPLGIGCLVGGVLLLLLGRWWSRSLLRRATVVTAAPGLELDLLAIALSGGHSIPGALALVGIPNGKRGIIDDTLRLSAAAGVPAVLLLRSAADEERRDARAGARQRAETLGVTLMLPLGLCVLPAFMLLGVAPLMLSIVASTLGSL